MCWFKVKTRKEKIIELESKVKAWNDTYGNVEGKLPGYIISRLESMLAKLYELRSKEELE